MAPNPDSPKPYPGTEDAIGPLGRPGADNWSQFHADASSQGSLFVATDFARRHKWEVNVGRFYMSSPVIGPDGTIHLGNFDGDIIAIRPDGSEKWRVTTPFHIYGAAAVARDGTVYAIGTTIFSNPTFPDHRFRSVLITIDADGTAQHLTILPDQGFTTGAPKLWFDGTRTWVLLHAYTRSAQLSQSAVLAFDDTGNLVARLNLGCTFHVTSNDSFLEGLLDALNPFATFDTSHPFHAEHYGWIDPTVALVERRDLLGRGKVLVVAADQRCSNMTGVLWEPPQLQRLWQVDEADKFIARSSPATLNGGQLVVSGRFDGKVIARNPMTGEELWKHDAGRPVLGTPASLGGLVYYTAGHIRSLDPFNGEVVHEKNLFALTPASVALSGNKVHVAHNLGFRTLTLDFESSFDDTSAVEADIASPAIGPDGTVYAVVKRGPTSQLRAYPAP
jgi:hypothetical protein